MMKANDLFRMVAPEVMRRAFLSVLIVMLGVQQLAFAVMELPLALPHAVVVKPGSPDAIAACFGP